MTPAPRKKTRPKLFAAAEFLKGEAAGGVALIVAAIAALIWANGPFGTSYFDFWGTDLTAGIGELTITEDLQHWVNDALMALFFFVIALEIKRELVDGELRDPRAASLPVLAAIGGVVLPAAIFLGFTLGTDYSHGWGIPMATDIAFAVGVLALLGSRIPAGAKLLLLTIAIVDDVLAIGVIAIFYTEGISVLWLAAAAGGLGAVAILRRLGVVSIFPYVLVGVFVWLAMLESGVHATIAGVAVGLMTPTGEVGGRRVLEMLERRLHPITTFVVIPVFALANAGVLLESSLLGDALRSPVGWGVVTGLVVGKLVGIGGATMLVSRLGIGKIPAGVGTAHVWGIAALGGIGFTVSLFIAQLSFADPEAVDIAKIGIFAGSIISAVLGVTLLLRIGCGEAKAEVEPR